MKSSKQEWRWWRSVAASGIKLQSLAADHMLILTLDAVLTRSESRERAVILRAARHTGLSSQQENDSMMLHNTNSNYSVVRRSDWFAHVSSPLLFISLNVIVDVSVLPSLSIRLNQQLQTVTAGGRMIRSGAAAHITSHCIFPQP